MEKVSVDSETEIQILRAENIKLKEKLIEMKAQNDLLNEQNKQLTDDFTAIKNMCGQDGLVIKLLEAKKIPTSQLFINKFAILGHETIAELEQLDASEQKDSTFVLKCMKKIFENDECSLNTVSASGREKNAIDKTTIDDLFIQRLANLNIEYKQMTQRYSRLNKLINSAKNNIIRVCIFV